MNSNKDARSHLWLRFMADKHFTVENRHQLKDMKWKVWCTKGITPKLKKLLTKQRHAFGYEKGVTPGGYRTLQ